MHSSSDKSAEKIWSESLVTWVCCSSDGGMKSSSSWAWSGPHAAFLDMAQSFQSQQCLELKVDFGGDVSVAVV